MLLVLSSRLSGLNIVEIVNWLIDSLVGSMIDTPQDFTVAKDPAMSHAPADFSMDNVSKAHLSYPTSISIQVP